MTRVGGRIRASIFVILVLLFFSPTKSLAQQPAQPSALGQMPQEGDYVTRDFHFKSDEILPELRLQ
jgi:hypothetical protein